ncbi:MAG: four helix bundle protein [Patescibacteria group bacterium]|nr:four helix bundle protein [Patescibacteria group bacterium]
MHKIKDAYLLWHGYHQIIPKTHRYTLGARIDSLFVETIEAVAAATFLSKEEKLPYVRLAIRKLDSMKVLLLMLWETKSLDNKKYIALSAKLEDCGRDLGGWSGQILRQTKQNPAVPTGKAGK